MSVWSRLLFNAAIIINLIVAFFYPFGDTIPDPGFHISLLIWLFMIVSTAVAFGLKGHPKTIRVSVMCWIMRLIFLIGPQPTLTLLGTLSVCLKFIHLMSIMGNSGAFGRSIRQILTDFELLYNVGYLFFCFLGLVSHPFFFSLLLFDVIYREETLINVIRSVTRNGRSILLTAVLALILVYMFSIIGYIFFKDDFLVEVDSDLVTIEAGSCSSSLVANEGDNDGKERACDSLIMCIITTLNQGLRNGGGIGDILRAPSSKVLICLFICTCVDLILNL